MTFEFSAKGQTQDNFSEFFLRMNLPPESKQSHKLVDHFFRHEYGRLLGRLARVLGNGNWETAEDAVQSAMQEALRVWGPRGIPSDPGGWLYKVAHRKAIDSLRRAKLHKKFLDQDSHGSREFEQTGGPIDQLGLDSDIEDDSLRMLFLCCDPSIPCESQIALTLKLAAGFGISEISRALLATESTIQKRITRAKEKLRENPNQLIRFSELEWAERVESVLQTIYLIFNEGYFSFTPYQVLRKDLCDEAIRLAILLDSTAFGCTPQTSALIALMLFHASRFESRQTDSDYFVSLEDQDRSVWDWAMIRRGMAWMQRSAKGAKVSRYHIEAAIAWEHCRATQFEETDWNRIGELYRTMLASKHSVHCQIGLAMAEFFCEGSSASIARLNACLDRTRVSGSLSSVESTREMTPQEVAACETLKGWVYFRIQQPERAIESLRSAIKCVVSVNQAAAIKRLVLRYGMDPELLSAE